VQTAGLNGKLLAFAFATSAGGAGLMFVATQLFGHVAK
jgi:hypothetical protein